MTANSGTYGSYFRNSDSSIIVYLYGSPKPFPIMTNKKSSSIITNTLPGLDDDDNYTSGNQIYINMGCYNEPVQFKIESACYVLDEPHLCYFVADSDEVVPTEDLTDIISVGDYIFDESDGNCNKAEVLTITSELITLKQNYNGTSGTKSTFILDNKIKTALEYFRDNLQNFIFCPQNGATEYNVALIDLKFEQGKGEFFDCDITLYNLGEV